MDLTVLAVSQKYAAFDRAYDESAVLALVDRNLGRMVVKVDLAVFEVAYRKGPTIDLPWHLHQRLPILLLEDVV